MIIFSPYRNRLAQGKMVAKYACVARSEIYLPQAADVLALKFKTRPPPAIYAIMGQI